MYEFENSYFLLSFSSDFWTVFLLKMNTLHLIVALIELIFRCFVEWKIVLNCTKINEWYFLKLRKKINRPHQFPQNNLQSFCYPFYHHLQHSLFPATFSNTQKYLLVDLTSPQMTLSTHTHHAFHKSLWEINPILRITATLQNLVMNANCKNSLENDFFHLLDCCSHYSSDFIGIYCWNAVVR